MELNNSYAGYTRNHSLLFIGKLRNRNSAFFQITSTVLEYL